MPTKRPRHMITETEPVQRALDELRSLQGEARIDFADLVIRGAEDRTRELKMESEARRQAVAEVAKWIREGSGPEIDVEAADEVKYLRLVANYDE